MKMTKFFSLLLIGSYLNAPAEGLAQTVLERVFQLNIDLYQSRQNTRTSVDCGDIPTEVSRVAENMIALRNSCAPLGRRSPASKPVIVADLSNTEGNMFVFDGQGRCFKQFDTNSWGHGGGDPATRVAPRHCSVNGSNYTPAGLHLVSEKVPASDKYNSDNSFAMLGLDDQGSLGRGILFHGGHAAAAASSLGCNALSDDEFSELRDCSPVDGMVYNYFGDTERATNCGRSEGYLENGGMPSCEEVTRNLNGSSGNLDPRHGDGSAQ